MPENFIYGIALATLKKLKKFKVPHKLSKLEITLKIKQINILGTLISLIV